MDNIAQVAKFLINNNLPNSFNDQKKWFIKNNDKVIPKDSEYADLIRKKQIGLN
jgi:hypothetical protein